MASCVAGSCDREWCRNKAADWIGDAFDVMGRTDIAVVLDALSPDFLRFSVDDPKLASQCVDPKNGIDGSFEGARMIERPAIVIAGLCAKRGIRELDPAIEDRWERWEAFDIAGSGWIPGYITIFPVGPKGTKYAIANALDPSKLAPETLTKEEAMGLAVDLLGDRMKNIRFVAAKLFFSFKFETEPWSRGKLDCLQSVLDSMTKKKGTMMDDGWLTKIKPEPKRVEWHYPALGPRQEPWVGSVHVASGDHVWHSAMSCRIRLPEKGRGRVGLRIVTTW